MSLFPSTKFSRLWRRTSLVTAQKLDMTVRVGCQIVYEIDEPTTLLLQIRPRSDDQHKVRKEKLTLSAGELSEEYADWQGNTCQRWVLSPGRTTIFHDALVSVSSRFEDVHHQIAALPFEQLPHSVLRYTLPSRYCDSDKILGFAARQFGHLDVRDRAVAICDWVHHNIKYVTGSGRSDISAVEIMERGYGVCRDFAHVGIALCRALNIPARYVSGHLPDIGYVDPGSPMDFHAYYEAYLANRWCTFDSRFNKPRIGRIKVAHGLDAVDVALTTTYGQGFMTSFEAWAYQVNPAQVAIGAPIDLSKRLDGTPLVRLQ